MACIPDPSYVIPYPKVYCGHPPPLSSLGASQTNQISETTDIVPTHLVEHCIQMCLQRDPRERWDADELIKHPFLHPDALITFP
jgi:serine/threonine protein kinase